MKHLLLFSLYMLVGTMGTLTYAWSFTDTAFGGWVGFLSGPISVILSALIGWRLSTCD